MSDLSEKDFLAELELLTSSLRQEIEAKALGLDTSSEAIKARRKRVLKNNDFEFFAYTYFPHHIYGEPSLFQQHFCKRVPQLLAQEAGCLEWWVAPRGEAKSSLASKILPIFCAARALLSRPETRLEVNWKGKTPPIIDYILFLGAETRLPTKLMEIVKTEHLVNMNLALDFPEIAGKGKVWRYGEALTNNGIKYEARGAEQAVRGATEGAGRPKLLVPDDIITDKEAKSETERNNRWDWIEKSIEYLGPPDGSLKSIGVGTILNKDCPISRAKKTIGHLVHHFKAIIKFPVNDGLWQKCEELMRNDDKPIAQAFADKDKVAKQEDLPSYKFYKRNRKAMDKGAVISWPSVRSLYWLMSKRAKSKRAFGTEMQGEAKSDEDTVFTEYQFWVSRLNHWIHFGACDPSIGKGQTAHPSAILGGAWDTNTKKLHVEYASIKRRVPSKLEADLIAFQKEFNALGIAFENSNAYEHSRTTFIKAAAAQGVSLPLVGYPPSVDKMIRIESLEPFITGIDPRILFHAGLKRLLEELDDFPEKQTEHDFDGLDALELLWRIAVARGSGVPQIATRKARSSHYQGYD